jgi:hypothetical protein
MGGSASTMVVSPAERAHAKGVIGGTVFGDACDRLQALAVGCLVFNERVREKYKTGSSFLQRIGYETSSPGESSCSISDEEAQQIFNTMLADWTTKCPYLKDFGWMGSLRRGPPSSAESTANDVADFGSSTSGIVTYRRDTKELFVIVQGSYLGLQDAAINAEVNFVPFQSILETVPEKMRDVAADAHENVKVHKGYFTWAANLIEELASMENLRTLDIKNVVITGHSLGAAVGAEMVALLRLLAGKCSIFSTPVDVSGVLFAQPNSFHNLRHMRNGDRDFFNKDVLNFCNVDDPVVRASESFGIYEPLGQKVKFNGGRDEGLSVFNAIRHGHDQRIYRSFVRHVSNDADGAIANLEDTDRLASKDPRFDFGTKIWWTRCSVCAVVSLNRGCQDCERLFCVRHFEEHRGSCGCPERPTAAVPEPQETRRPFTTEAFAFEGGESPKKRARGLKTRKQGFKNLQRQTRSCSPPSKSPCQTARWLSPRVFQPVTF